MPFGEQPAYLRVAGDLRQKIVGGDLPPHTRLPSQAKIRAEYGVSDTVALEARKVLMAEGLVEGRSGSGTYVREHPVPRSVSRTGYRTLGESTPFRQEQADEDVKGTWESRSEQKDAGPLTAERLGIEPGERVMRTRYVFRVEGEPSMLSTSWEPLSITGRTPVMLPEEGPARRQGRGGAYGCHRRRGGQRRRGGRRPSRSRRGDDRPRGSPGSFGAGRQPYVLCGGPRRRDRGRCRPGRSRPSLVPLAGALRLLASANVWPKLMPPSTRPNALSEGFA